MTPQLMQMDREKISLNLARLKKGGDTFEVILDDVDGALEIRRGKDIPVKDVINGEFVFKNARKAEKATEKGMKQWLGTSDHFEAAKVIIKKGEINLTAEERQKMLEKKKKRILEFIHRNAADPKSGLPLPMQRIELAIKEAKVSIDPADTFEFQSKKIIEQLQPVLPMSFEQARFRVILPAKFAGSAYSAVKSKHTLHSETWRNDGSVQFEMHVPAGTKSDLYSLLNKLTNGEVQIEELK